MKTVLLTNFIPPYRIPLYTALSRELGGEFAVWASVEIESNRTVNQDWKQGSQLKVVLQKTLTLKTRQKHPDGYSDVRYIHIPYDTFFRLWRAKPDIVISAEMGARTFFCALYKWLRPKTKFVIWATLSVHTEKGVGFLKSRFRRLLLSMANVVIVNGRDGEAYIRSLVGAKLTVVHLPCTPTLSFFEPISPKSRSSVRKILFVGQMIPRKGILQSVRRIVEICNKQKLNVELSFCGEGPELKEIQNALAGSSVQSRFFGFVPYKRMLEVMQESDVLCFPTLGDEWGLVVNEAMLRGLPVLGSNKSQAVTELVTAQNGWVFDPSDKDNFKSAFLSFLSVAVEDLNRISVNARQVAESINPDQIARRIVSILKD